MIEKNRNRVRKILKDGGTVSGAWLQAGSPITAEILAEAGYEALWSIWSMGPGMS